MFTYFKICFKKTIYYLPAFLAGSILILLLAGGALHICLSRTAGASLINIRVGIVASPDEPMLDWIMDILQEMKSTTASCEFKLMSEEDADSALRSGEISTAFIIPENYIHSLMVGENSPVIIRYHKDSVDIASFLIRQLTEAASSYIISTEAAIYSMQDYYAINGIEPLYDDAKALNLIFLDEVIKRDHMIKSTKSYSALDLPLALYYTLAFLVLWIFMSGLCACRMCGGMPGSLMRRVSCRMPSPSLHSSGMSAGSRSYGPLPIATQTLLRFLSFIVVMCGFYLLITPLIALDFSPIAKTNWSDSVLVLIRFLPAVICAEAFIFTIYTWFSQVNVGIMFLSFFTLACGFVCGCFHPMQYLPESFDTVSKVLPMRGMMEYMGTVCSGSGNDNVGFYLAKLIVMTVAAVGFAIAGDVYYSRKS